MGKRVGANVRKKKAERRKKRPLRRSGFMRYMSTGVLYAGLLAAGTAMLVRYKDQLPGIDGIADRLKLKHATVESVVMQGAVHMTPEEIIRRSGLKLPVTLDQLKREYLYVLSKTSPWIEKVHFMTAEKGAVTLGIVERRPFALVQMRDGAKVVLVDAEGVCLPLDPQTVRELPLVSGLTDSIGEYGIRRLTIDDCGRMNRFFSIAAKVDPAFVRHITQAHFTPDGIARIKVAGSPTVITLDERNASLELQHLILVWEATAGDSLRPGRIDLSCRNLAFVSTGYAAPDRSAYRQTDKSKQAMEKKTKVKDRL
jgi:hypothetical protein